ncbi:MAG: hypothetical protein JETT_3901 [Candidatus Jettenia ecosi]|uniref:Uncharacterized protein n=1 Tax=Candidatus Jettenia ecosi TaxID=2494326 RepID=A0A533QB66_9BACT|nr:MAG: hypothetical protein JETT_3901 [Candidatus Jettenia ecosi]
MLIENKLKDTNCFAEQTCKNDCSSMKNKNKLLCRGRRFPATTLKYFIQKSGKGLM